MLELLVMGGIDVMHAMRLLMPPAWQTVDGIDPDLRAFYEFYAPHMESWDGPAGVVLTDGRYVACTLDRNGLRPARYVITKNRHLTVASEIGVWDYAPEDVVRKGRMGPGQMLALDLQTATLLENDDIDGMAEVILVAARSNTRLKVRRSVPRARPSSMSSSRPTPIRSSFSSSRRTRPTLCGVPRVRGP